MDEIRELFSKTKEAMLRGYKIGRFSFNVKGGRCEKCQGEGEIKIEMHFYQILWLNVMIVMVKNIMPKLWKFYTKVKIYLMF